MRIRQFLCFITQHRFFVNNVINWNYETSKLRSIVAAKDRFHQVVKTALIKDGWDVTHDPLQIKVGGVDMEIDLGAERLLAAERAGEKIAVEIKSFLTSASAISEFHTALGQFINYRAALRRE